MTPEEQRIAIAEACGWKVLDIKGDLHGPKFYRGPENREVYEAVDIFMLPEYLNDLNAMHEAEKSLSEFQFAEYCTQLGHVTYWGKGEVIERFELVSATAAQRAEAFLRTLNKWTET